MTTQEPPSFVSLRFNVSSQCYQKFCDYLETQRLSNRMSRLPIDESRPTVSNKQMMIELSNIAEALKGEIYEGIDNVKIKSFAEEYISRLKSTDSFTVEYRKELAKVFGEKLDEFYPQYLKDRYPKGSNSISMS